MTDTDPTPQQIAFRAVTDFNREAPKGTAVLAWPGLLTDEPLRTRTRTCAWVLPSGEPVVSVHGYAGGIALSHVAVDEDRRPVPPGLEFRCPECPMCGKETDSDGDGFRCETCEVSWGRNGEDGEWDDRDEPGCPSVIEWFNDDQLSPEHEGIRHTTDRCMLPAEHHTDHRDFDGKEWTDDDPRVIVWVEDLAEASRG